MRRLPHCRGRLSALPTNMVYDHHEALQTHMANVYQIIREGLALMSRTHDPRVFEQLAVWYREEDAYLTRLMGQYRMLLLDLLDVRILTLRTGRHRAG